METLEKINTYVGWWGLLLLFFQFVRGCWMILKSGSVQTSPAVPHHTWKSFFSALHGVQINRHFDMFWGGCRSGGRAGHRLIGKLVVWSLAPSVCMPGILGQDTNPQLFYILCHLHVTKPLNHNIYDSWCVVILYFFNHEIVNRVNVSSTLPRVSHWRKNKQWWWGDDY